MSFNLGDVVTVDFPGVTGIKRRPAVVLSSATNPYNSSRRDSWTHHYPNKRTKCETDYGLQDWAAAGLRVASVFRSFIVTLPPTANLVLIGHLSERDWKGVRACVKVALAELDDHNPSSDTPSLS